MEQTLEAPGEGVVGVFLPGGPDLARPAGTGTGELVLMGGGNFRAGAPGEGPGPVCCGAAIGGGPELLGGKIGGGPDWMGGGTTGGGWIGGGWMAGGCMAGGVF